MALVAAAVCPHPPLLVPAVGRGIDLLAREAAREAAARVVAAEPDLVVLVGADRTRAQYGPADSGSFLQYGVDLTVPLEPAAGGPPPTMPLSLTVGGWLLAEAEWLGNRLAYGVPDAMPQPDAIALGAEIAGLADRVALLCLGDGSARRTEKAPGWLDRRAEPFDREVADALADADPDRLTALDRELAAELLVAGGTSWQVLAGAARGGSWFGELLADEAPFGVGYFVAVWHERDATSAAPA